MSGCGLYDDEPEFVGTALIARLGLQSATESNHQLIALWRLPNGKMTEPEIPSGWYWVKPE